VIAATASEALHVLETACLLYHHSDVTVRRHHTDAGGDSDHVFALLALLGFQFAPRILDLKSRRLYSLARPSAYPTLEPLIAGRINVALIRACAADEVPTVSSRTCRHSAGSTLTSPVTMSGRAQTKRRKARTIPAATTGARFRACWLHAFPICPLMHQGTFRYFWPTTSILS
jgi:TnpA family transposase